METPDEFHGQIATRYRDARFVIGVADLLGRLSILVGLVWFGWSAFMVAKLVIREISGAEGNPLSILSFLSLGPSLGLVLGGILIFANGQLLRATLDTADLTRELLRLKMRSLSAE